jgi:hypothetical protein
VVSVTNLDRLTVLDLMFYVRSASFRLVILRFPHLS